ncbi:hypothetical protein [Mesorhizobium sophorae]|uniref:hypothetical protein n=1 Tax=Mesorhizobium sophorae TaxID=1300294 RepID=UPI001FD90FD2|nr:hypothetical protein [Mesorhizobium sophorae]
MMRPPSPSIAGGTYFTYISIPHRPGLLMRSVTFVRREAEPVTYQKGHRMVGRRASAWAQARGNHHREATSRLNWICLSGINRRQTGEPSLISVQ